MTQQSAFSGHIGSGDDDYLLLVVVEIDIVGHEALTHGQLLLNHGVSALAYVELQAVVDHRAHVVVVFGHLGKAHKAVELGDEVGVDLYLGDELLHGRDELGEELLLEGENLLVGTQNLLLVLLELLGNVALCLCQRLLAHPLGRHAVLEGVAHLEVVAEHIVVAHLERGDARLLNLALLNLHEILLAVVRYVAQVVELGAVASGYHVALGHELWRVGLYLALYALSQALAEIELLADALQGDIVGVGAGVLDGLYRHEGVLELDHLAGRHAAHCHLGDDALEVAYAMELVIDQHAEVGGTEEAVDHVEPLAYGVDIAEREDQPASQHAAAHRGDGAVDDIEQRTPVFLHGLEQFERAYGEAVEAHILLFLEAGQRGDVADMGVLGNLEILHDGSGGYDAVVEMVYAKSLERLGGKMAQELLPGGLLGKHPVVELEDAVAVAKPGLEVGLAGAVVEHLLGLEVAQELLYIVIIALAGKELAGRDVEKADST